MTLCDTPTVPQRSLPSPDSINTRTTAPVPSPDREHADFIVEQLDLLERRIKFGQRAAQRLVERVDRPVAHRRGVLHHAVDLHHDRRFGNRRLALFAFFVDHAKADQVEILLLLAERFLDQQLERRLRRLELVALAFQLFGAAQNIL